PYITFLSSSSPPPPPSPPFPYTTLFRSHHGKSHHLHIAAVTIGRIGHVFQCYLKDFFIKFSGPVHVLYIDLEPAYWVVLFVFHGDRKSTRLNSSHVKSSYAVCCLKTTRF